MPATLHFTGWSRPVLASVIEHLTRDWRGPVLDLQRTLVIVPTRQAGRRLREGLALEAEKSGAGVLPPRVLPPEAFLARLDKGTAPVASPVISGLAWAQVLTTVDLEECREVFPVDPVDRDLPWAAGVARSLETCRRALAESGLTLDTARQKLGSEFTDAARWAALSRLEQRYLAVLREHGLRDAQSAKIENAAAPEWPEEIDRIIIAAVPDPMPLAFHALARLEARSGVPVHVLVPAPAALAHAFDAWGRPLTSHWPQQEIPLPDFDRMVRLCANPAAQAAAAAALLARHENPVGAAAIGLLDAEVGPALEERLAQEDRAAFNPDGRPAAQHPLCEQLRLLRELLGGRPFHAFARWLRDPLVLESIAANPQLLEALDEFQAEHLPATLDRALTLATPGPLRQSMQLARRLLEDFTRLPFPLALQNWLAESCARHTFSAANPDDAAWIHLAGELGTSAAEIEAAAQLFPALRLGPTGKLDLLLRSIQDTALPVERPAAALDLNGWLEMPWEDAPHLILTGFNDGSVPDAVTSDPFLPDSLRRTLDLRCNDDRLARDASLLRFLLESRAGSGRVDILLGRTTAAGDPLRPSRLLFRCPDAALPARALALFHATDADDGPPPPPWQLAWTLTPPAPAAEMSILHTLHVTAFRDYLACPFRFYLSHGVGMSSVDPGMTEMSHADFGTVLHHALRDLASTETLRTTDDEPVLREFLLSRLDEVLATRYGTPLTTPLAIQAESARQRLAAAARIIAAQRADGWVTEATELRFRDLLGHDLQLPGTSHVIRGTIDLIEHHPATGRRRVIDYKTSGSAKDPADEHWINLKKRRDQSARHPWMLATDATGSPRRWRNLQLPLYAAALREKYCAVPAAGYFQLPKAASQSALVLWEDFDERTLESALACARGVMECLSRREFWPPSENVDFDAYESIFFGNAGAACTLVPQ